MLEKLPDVVGHALGSQRAGLENVMVKRISAQRDLPRIDVSSSAFNHQSPIPAAFTADGEGISPPISWRNVPPETHRVALIVEDADSPTPHPLVHAIALFSGGDRQLQTGDLPSPDHSSAQIQTGLNSYFQHAWLPPDPPPGHGPHRYVFQVFALGPGAELSEGPGRGDLERAVCEHAVAGGYLIGLYERGARESAKRDDAVAAPYGIPVGMVD